MPDLEQVIERVEARLNDDAVAILKCSDVRALLEALRKTPTEAMRALERIGKRKLGGPWKPGQIAGERREMIEIAREALAAVRQKGVTEADSETSSATGWPRRG